MPRQAPQPSLTTIQMPNQTSAAPYGFLLVTTDPHLVSGGKGSAYDLVLARLRQARWPLYKGTRNRDRLVEGSRVAFYVAGDGAKKRTIVATGLVTGRHAARFGEKPIDPPEYMTQPASIVLELGNVAMLEEAVPFRKKLPQLSFRPRSLKMWGGVLMGGARGLTAADWEILFGAT